MNIYTLMEGTAEEIRTEFAEETRIIYKHVADGNRFAIDIARDVRKAMAAMVNVVGKSSVRDFSIFENNGGFQILVVWQKGVKRWSEEAEAEAGVEYVHVFQTRGEAWETLARILQYGDDESVAECDGNEVTRYREEGTLGSLLSEMDDAEEIIDSSAGVGSSAIAFALLFGGSAADWEGL